MPDYRERISEARELLELAAQAGPEGRAAVRRWAGQVAAALPEDEDEVLAGDQDEVLATEGEPAVLQPVPDALAAQGYTYNRQAMARAGYELALSETGDGPVIMLGDQYDNGGTMQYDAAAIYQATVQDEVDRLSIMAMGGPQRPQYAGLALSEPAVPDEVDDGDVSTAIMQLAGHAGEDADYGLVADAVDEMALSRTPDTANETASRAAALVRVAGMFPGSSGSPAAGELDLELARQREIDRISERTGRGRASDRIARRQGASPSEAETAEEEVDRIVAEHRDMLGHAPRRGQTHLSSDSDYDKYREQNEGGQPSKGGIIHPEVERLLRSHGALIGFDPNTVTPVKSARQREREERRSRAGHQAGLFSIEQLHRQALRSATSSRG